MTIHPFMHGASTGAFITATWQFVALEQPILAIMPGVLAVIMLVSGIRYLWKSYPR